MLARSSSARGFRAGTEVGYPWLTPKDLRPAFATDLLEKGLETPFVSEPFGHSSVKVTEQFYIKRRQVEACRRVLRVMRGAKGKQVNETARGLARRWFLDESRQTGPAFGTIFGAGGKIGVADLP